MSTDCYAPPDERPTAVARLLRLGRLLAHLGAMWLTARLLAPRLSRAQRAATTRFWAARLLAAIAVEVRVRGTRPRAGEAALFVANHVSWLDTYALHTVHAARFVAKDEVAGWPIIGVIAARFGTLFIRRGSRRAAAHTVAALAQALCEGESVAAFPEATTSDGTELLPFFPAMFQSAVVTGARVHPVAIRYCDRAGRPTSAAAFVGDMSIAASLRLLLDQSRIVAELTFCAPIDPNGLDRKALGATARTAIATALQVPSAAASPTTPLRRAA